MKAVILIQTQFQVVVTLKTMGDITRSAVGTDLDREEQSKAWGKMALLAPLVFLTVSCSRKHVWRETNHRFFTFSPSKNLLTWSLAFWFLPVSIMNQR